MFHPGALKSTYGTGCFVIINTGDTLLPAFDWIAYRLNGKTTYALEGSISSHRPVSRRDGAHCVRW